jgi:hypothetical protein
LALNAIPADLRARVRGFIEGFLNPLGGVLGGIVILALRQAAGSGGASHGGPDPVTLAGALLAIAWIVVVWRARRHYMDLVEANLASADKRTAMDAIDCLEEPGNARAIALLRQVGASPDGEKRSAAIRVWGNIGGDDAPFAAACADPELRVRVEALHAIGRAATRGPLASTALAAAEQSLAADPDPRVRAAAWQALRQTSRQSDELIRRWLAAPQARVRAYVVEAIGDSGGDLRAWLSPLLDDPEPLVRAATVQALWPCDELRAALRQALAALLTDAGADADAQIAVLLACHRIGECPAPQALNRLLVSPDPIARVLAGALMLSDAPDPDQRGDALDAIFAVLGDETLAERLRVELLPHVPDLHESAADAILNAVGGLPDGARQRVSAVLADWYRVLQTRLQTERL